MVAPPINVPVRHIVDFCRHNAVRKLSLFGSILSGSFSDAVHVDILVEFDPGRRDRLFGTAAMERELRQFRSQYRPPHA